MLWAGAEPEPGLELEGKQYQGGQVGGGHKHEEASGRGGAGGKALAGG